MNASGDDTDKILLPNLTVDQRRQIYAEEKYLIEQTAPMLSKKTKILIAVYLLGCVLIYFGITNAVIEFWGTRKWALKPEPHYFESLFEAVLTLIRPFCAVVISFWAKK